MDRGRPRIQSSAIYLDTRSPEARMLLRKNLKSMRPQNHDNDRKWKPLKEMRKEMQMSSRMLSRQNLKSMRHPNRESEMIGKKLEKGGGIQISARMPFEENHKRMRHPEPDYETSSNDLHKGIQIGRMLARKNLESMRPQHQEFETKEE